MISQDTKSDPTRRTLRSVRRNYKELLDGDDATRKSIAEEQNELANFSGPGMEKMRKKMLLSQKVKGKRRGRKDDEEIVYTQEDQLMAESKIVEEKKQEDDSDEYFDDNYDGIDQDDMLDDKPQEKKIFSQVGKKSAADRANENDGEGLDVEDLNQEGQEADETVFIDNLPKDEKALKDMM